LVAGALLFAGSTIGFVVLQFAIEHRRFIFVGSVFLIIAALVSLGLAIWIAGSGSAPYSVSGVQVPEYHPTYH
jgi:hypothetical protein